LTDETRARLRPDQGFSNVHTNTALQQREEALTCPRDTCTAIAMSSPSATPRARRLGYNDGERAALLVLGAEGKRLT
jgi:hypothetical protein